MIWTASNLQFKAAKTEEINREDGAMHTLAFDVAGFPGENEIRLAFVRRGDQPAELVPPHKKGGKVIPARYAPPQSGFIPCMNVDMDDVKGKQTVELQISIFERQTGFYDLFAWTSSLEDDEELNQVCVLEKALEIVAKPKQAKKKPSGK
jgi:hypothetical protein